MYSQADIERREVYTYLETWYAIGMSVHTENQRTYIFPDQKNDTRYG